MAAFTIATYVGNALAPTLVNEGPIALLILSPKIRWLLLASPNVEAHLVLRCPAGAGGRLLGTYFLLGRWYGDRALRWLESPRRATRSGRCCGSSGSSTTPADRSRSSSPERWPRCWRGRHMPFLVFLAVALLSIELRLWAVRALAEVFHGPLVDVLGWIGDNQLWLTVVSVGSVIGWAMWSNRHGLTQGETIEEIIEDFDTRRPARHPTESRRGRIGTRRRESFGRRRRRRPGRRSPDR